MGEYYQFSVIIQRKIGERGFISDLDSWCNKNLTGAWLRDPQTSFNIEDWMAHYYFEFELESDAVLFKLKWT
jgi:hypothetical protein